MDDQVIFANIMNTFGFINDNQFAEITGQGIISCSDLCNLTSDELELIFAENRNSNRRRNLNTQIILPILACSRLEAFRYELSLRQLCDSPMTIAQLNGITPAIARVFVLQLQDRKESRANADALPDIVVPKLEKQNWRSFRDAFTELLSRKIGSNGIPLSYIIRDMDDNSDYNSEEFETINDKLVHCINLTGAKFTQDNKDVYSLLNTYLKESQGESIVKKLSRTRHGRNCWKALKVHFESESYKSSMKAIAIANIRASEYTGPKKNFNLGSLYLIHTQSHNMLEEAGLPYSEAQKIQEFQTCLKEKTSIEKLVATINTIGLDPTFEDYYNSLNGELSAIITLSEAANNQKSNRSINELTTGGPPGPGGRGGGRGRGRGGRGGRDGRGRGRGGRFGRGRGGRGGRGNRYNAYNDATNHRSWQPHLGAYADEEWYNLSQEQKQRVFDLRNAAKNHDDCQQSVNQVTFNDSTIPTQIVDTNANDQSLPPPPSSQQVPNPNSTTGTQPNSSVHTPRGRAGTAFGSYGREHSGRGRGRY